MSKELFKIETADGTSRVLAADEGCGDDCFVLRGLDGVEITLSHATLDSLARQWLAHSAIHDGYTKAELESAFKKVQNADHWKNPIDAVILIDDMEIVDKAIAFFTATKATFHKLQGKSVRVIAPGYYAGPAN